MIMGRIKMFILILLFLSFNHGSAHDPRGKCDSLIAESRFKAESDIRGKNKTEFEVSVEDPLRWEIISNDESLNGCVIEFSKPPKLCKKDNIIEPWRFIKGTDDT